MRQIIWICDQCGLKVETDDEYEPEGWITDIKKNKVYHSRECMFTDMTPDEIEKFKGGTWMASPPDLGVKVSDGLGIKGEMK